MKIVNSREFRANLKTFLGLALKEDVVVTSRTLGSFRLVPVDPKDMVVDDSRIEKAVIKGLKKYKTINNHSK